MAAARSAPDKAGAQFAEAQSAFDSLPAEVRGLSTSRMLQGLIADAQRERR